MSSIMSNFTEPKIMMLLIYIICALLLLGFIFFTNFDIGNYGGVFK